MRIITYKRIQEFSKKYSDVIASLNFWYHTTKSKDWSSFNELKEDFPSADYVGNNRFIFNIKRNDRLVAVISFNAKKVYVRFIETHAKYDKNDGIKNI